MRWFASFHSFFFPGKAYLLQAKHRPVEAGPIQGLCMMGGESQVCNPLLFYGRGCSHREQFPTASKSSVSTFYPPSSLPAEEEELLHLSPDTQLLARVVSRSTHLHHHSWPGCLASPERSVGTRVLTVFSVISACRRGLGRAEPRPGSGHCWRLVEKKNAPSAGNPSMVDHNPPRGCTLRTTWHLGHCRSPQVGQPGPARKVGT